jgi:predicted nucleic acid-binding protein
MKFLLDTNVFREIGKTEPHRNVEAWLSQVDDADLAISALTVREVRKGIVKLHNKNPQAAVAIDKRVTEALAAFGERILPITREIADLWGQLLAQRDKHTDDTGLAATARVHGLMLVSRNIEHVSDRGVQVLDPFKTRTG